MGTAGTPGDALPAGGEDRKPVLPGFGAIPAAVFDAAAVPFTLRVLELAIPATERADAAVTTDMGVSGSGLTACLTHLMRSFVMNTSVRIG